MKHYPKKLISFRNLEGGQYGTIDVTARHRTQVEIALGGDYVWLTRDQWLALRVAVDAVMGPEFVETVVVKTGADGKPEVIEDVIKEGSSSRHGDRARSKG